MKTQLLPKILLGFSSLWLALSLQGATNLTSPVTRWSDLPSTNQLYFTNEMQVAIGAPTNMHFWRIGVSNLASNMMTWQKAMTNNLLITATNTALAQGSNSVLPYVTNLVTSATNNLLITATNAAKAQNTNTVLPYVTNLVTDATNNLLITVTNTALAQGSNSVLPYVTNLVQNATNNAITTATNTVLPHVTNAIVGILGNAPNLTNPVIYGTLSAQDFTVDTLTSTNFNVGGVTNWADLTNGFAVASAVQPASANLTNWSGIATSVLASITSTSATTNRTVQVVGTRAASPYMSEYASGWTAATSRSKHVIPVSCNSLQLVYSSTEWVSITVGETNYPQPFEIVASVETPSGRIIPAYFSGRRIKTVYPNCGLVYSDPVGSYFKGGETIYVRTFCNIEISSGYYRSFNAVTNGLYGEPGTLTTNGTKWPYYQKFNTLAQTLEGVTGQTTNGGNPFLSDFTDGGTIAASANYAYWPVAVLGETFAGTTPSVAIIGTSISAAVGNDLSDYTGVNSGFGFWNRVLGDSYPRTFISQTGDYASTWTNTWLIPTRMQLASKCKYWGIELGNNDIFSGGLNTDQTISRISNVVVMARNIGATPFLCTITPRSTSTDQWKTIGNQTTVAGNDYRVSVNAWIRTNTFCTNYFEIADQVESARDSGLWKCPTNAADSGTATGGSSTALTDTGKAWTAHAWIGCTVTNITQQKSAFITENTTNSLSLTGFTTSGGDSYEILANYTLDGIHPSLIGHTNLATAVLTNRFR